MSYWSQIAIFAYPTYIRRPRYGGPCRNIVTLFGVGKTRMVGLPDSEKV